MPPCTSTWLLQVATEDTVLYTAQAYMNQFSLQPIMRQLVQLQLAPLIRCQHLSSFCLSAAAKLPGAANLLLSYLTTWLTTLLTLRYGDPRYVPTAADLKRLLPGAPDSWAAPKRAFKPVSAVRVTWQLKNE